MEINKKSIIFYVLLCVFLISSIILSFGFFPQSRLINIIVEVSQKSNIFFKVDNEYISPILFKNVYNSTIKKKVREIDILIDENDKNKIKSFLIYNNSNSYYYPDFFNLENSKQKICEGSICKNYIKYKITPKIKENNKNYINDFSFEELFSNIVINFFRANPIFLYSYILLFICIIYFLNNQKEIKIPKIKGLYPLLVLSCFVLSYLFFEALYDVPWGDETYSILISNPSLSYSNIFNDAGNPPFYYLILKTVLLISSNYILLRLVSLGFVILAFIILFNFLKKEYSSRIANLVCFFFLINIPLNYYSIEIRSYPLQVLLIVLSSILTYKLLNKSKIKYWIYYLILGIVSFNTHYYLILYFLANGIYLGFCFIKDKRYKDLIYLFIVSTVSLLLFMPYFFHTALNKALLDETFNSHLPKVSLGLIKDNLFFIFGGLFSFVLSLIFFLKALFDKNYSEKHKKTVIYIFYIIFSIFILSIILSLIIRPMIAFRYYLFLIPLYLVFLAVIFSNEKNKKIISIFVLWILFSQNYSFNHLINIRKSNAACIDVLKTAKTYKKYNKNKKIIIVIRKSNAATVEYRKDLFIKDALYMYVYRINEETEKIKKENDDYAIFTDLLSPNKENSFLNNEYTCFFNSAKDLCVWKIEKTTQN